MQRELVERAKRGDADAFTQLVMASAPRLAGVAHLILRDHDRAKDAVQEACISAWKDMRALRDPDAWDAWLRRLTVNACYKVAAKERRRTHVEQHVAPAPDSDRTPDAASGVAEREWVLSELDRLDTDRRAVLVLHYYLDLPLTEVAEILGIPYGTVTSRLHRGLEAMRRSIGGTPGAASDLAAERSR